MYLYNRKTLLDLQSQCDINAKDIDVMLQKFVDTSNVSGMMPIEEFGAIMKTNFPAFASNQEHLDRIFKLMDTNDDGLINFREFVVGTVFNLEDG